MIDGRGQAGDSGAQMTFWDHLEVLRWSIFRVIIALVVLVVACFIAMPYIFDPVILGPAHPDFFLYRWFESFASGIPFVPGGETKEFSVQIININVASQFLTHVSTSFWVALLLLFPYMIYEIWHFVEPALFPREKKSVGKAFLFGTFMFYLGCAAGYCLVFPLTFRFLTEYQVSASIVNQISLNSYMSNFLGMVFVMGVVFEMPLLAWLLSSIGILDKAFLKKYRKHAVVVLLVLSAIITPSGDPFTLMVVFIPLYLLYELAIAIVRPARK